ncbi:MAG: carotenoid oxygenase family protein [Sandaracinaceae bacterium]
MQELLRSVAAVGANDETRVSPRQRGDMKSIARELDFEPLRVEGRIPDGLRGQLVRTGPGLYELFGKKVTHSFEGDGAVSAVRIEGGPGAARALGAIKLIESEGLLAERRAGKPLFGPRAAYPRRLWNSLRRVRKNTGNTAMMTFRDRLFALVESSKPTEIDPRTLRTIGETDLGVIEDAFSAHPHRVIARAQTIGFGLAYGPKTTIQLYALNDRGSPAVARLGEVPLTRPVMLHDFAVTPTRALFLVSPVRLHIFKALLGLTSFGNLVSWRPEDGVEVIVVPLDAPDRHTRFVVEPFFQWHFAGARDDGDDLVVDFVRHPDFATYEGLRERGPRSTGQLVRARVSPTRKKLAMDLVWDGHCEFPRLDPRFEGRADAPYRKVFLTQEDQGYRHLAMVDVETGRVRLHPLPEGHAGSEVVFVPRTPDAPEGDGWALALVHDPVADRTHLRIVDTARFEDEPVARCLFPEWVPMTFHGLWTGSLSVS